MSKNIIIATIYKLVF